MNRATKRLKNWFRKYGVRQGGESFKSWVALFPDGEAWLERKRASR